MREIKFRYRVKDLNNERIIFYEKSLKEIESGLVILNNKTYLTLSRDQSTGLKDKNGKEIYEGDILGYWKNATWEVLWSNDKSAFRFGNHVTNFSMKETKKKEVIGNIYQNPELLK